MCYWVGTRKVRAIIEERIRGGTFDEIDQLFYESFLGGNKKLEYQEHYVAIGKAKPVISVLASNKGKWEFKNMQWTLPYSYTDKSGRVIRRELLNSTCERVFQQHKDIIFTRRCIVPIDGYFEYHHFNKQTYPYYIYHAHGGIFYAGGIWNEVADEETGEIKECFSIITTKPNPFVGAIHNNPEAPNGPRMLALIQRESALEYLADENDIKKISGFFTPLHEKLIKAHTVLRFQKKDNIPFQNTPKVLEYYEYPELVYQNRTLF